MESSDGRTPARRSLDPGGPSGTQPEGGGWRSRFPERFVFLSLACMVALPMVAQRSIDHHRRMVHDVIDPARTSVAEIQLALTLESASRRGFLLTGDDSLAQSIRASRERRLSAEAALRSVSDSVGGPVPAAVARLAARLRAVDAHLDSVVAEGGDADAYVRRIDAHRHRFTAALAAAQEVREALAVEGDGHQLAARRIEALVGTMVAALAALALVATLLVARLRRQAEARRRALERVTESRTRLLRGFTHDVKNPLGVVDGYLSLLADGVYGALDPPQRDAVSKGRRAVRQALDLIASLLEIARAEAGQLELHVEHADLRAIVADSAEAFRGQAEAKGLTLATAPLPELPPVETDAARVRQVIANLLSNAVKYTPPGGHVRVGAAMTPDGGRRWAAISVADDGPGIPSDRIGSLFREFTRLDPKAAEGAGIGLAISQRIAQALGGAIDVRSRPGEGSTFTFRLPVD